MALSGPQRPHLASTHAPTHAPTHAQPRAEELQADTLAKALELAREIEELLEDTRSVASQAPVHDARTHATRMARAMAASLVDELDALVRPPSRRTGAS
jgi:hypothetical protein